MINNIENKSKILKIILKTWTGDTVGIFDYSSLSPKEDKAIIKESQYIVRDKNNRYMKNTEHANINFRNGDDIIFLVDKVSDNIYTLVNAVPKKLEIKKEHLNNINNKLWYVIKKEGDEDESKNNKEYYLQKNDIIKFGRVKYIVIDINIKHKDGAAPALSISDLNSNKGPIFNIVYEVKKDINEKSTPSNKGEYKCDFCKYKNTNTISETDDGEDYLIKICYCENKYYHYKCLKAYTQISIEKENNIKDYGNSIEIKDFQCKSCHEEFPFHFKLPNDDKIYSLVDIKEPDCDYVILESLDYKKDDIFYKSIHVIKFLKEIISIGRGNESDIVLKDISISRNHAVLKIEKETGKVCIQNRSKKFGTSVLIKDPLKLDKLDKKFFLQVGRTYIECYLSNEIEENIKKDKSDLNKNNNENKNNKNNGEEKENNNNNNIINDEEKKEDETYCDKPE